MKNFLHKVPYFVLFLFISSSAILAQSNCSDVLLLSKTSYILEDHQQASLAWLSLIEQNNYQEKKREANGRFKKLFKAGFSDFVREREKLFRQENYTFNKAESRNIIQTILPDDAVKAWRDCELNKTGLTVWIDQAKEHTITLSINWKPEVGLGNITNVNIDMEGSTEATKLEMNNIKKIARGNRRYILKRRNANEDIQGVINGQVGHGENSGSVSVSFYIPPFLDDFWFVQKYQTIDIEDEVWVKNNLREPATTAWSYKDEIEYGLLYTWESAKNACPKGWHLPNKAEAEKLITIAGGSQNLLNETTQKRAFSNLIMGGALGFNAVQGGSRYLDKEYQEQFAANNSVIWLSTEKKSGWAYYLDFDYSRKKVSIGSGMKSLGQSCRCVKD